MIYGIKFIMADIKNDSDDPWEVHFNIENEDDEVISTLKKDFTFEIGDLWIVSANRPDSMISKYRLKWYIRGSLSHVDGNKKYYNKTVGIAYHKHNFNDEVTKKYPEIRDRFYDGQFDSLTKIMKIF